MTTNLKNKETTTAPSSVKPLVQDVLRLIEDFGSLLVKETEALKKADYLLVDMLQTDKKNFAKLYHAKVTELSARKDEMPTLDMPMRERLIKARTSFTIILNENLRALEASRESTRRLVDRILDTARKAVADELQTNYSSKGKAQAYKTATLSLSLDQSL